MHLSDSKHMLYLYDVRKLAESWGSLIALEIKRIWFKSWTHTSSVTLGKLSICLSFFIKSQNCKIGTSYIFFSELFWEINEKMTSEVIWQNYKAPFGMVSLEKVILCSICEMQQLGKIIQTDCLESNVGILVPLICAFSVKWKVSAHEE